MATINRKEQRRKRQVRGRKRIAGTAERPRLAVYRSNKHITVQIINDEDSITLCGLSSYSKDLRGKINGASIAGAEQLGKAVAEKATASGIAKVVFDRGGNLYHGRVKALADAARKAGLEF